LKRILTENGYIEDGTYYFHKKDHLGNNRWIGDEDGNVVQYTDYYPFGLPFDDSTNPDTQPYKYNGKEYDRMHGLNMYDYSARYYDPAFPVFTTVDPLAEKYYEVSPYAYCLNNPIKYIDPDGRKVVVSGTKVYREQVKKDLKQIEKDNSDVGKMIKDLIQSDHVHKIEMPKKGKFNYSESDKEKRDNGTPQGSTIGYDPNERETASGDDRTPRAGLAHELQHSSDVDKGTFDGETKTETGVPLSEVDAIKTENKIREKTGDDKRTTYEGKKISSIWLDN